MAAASARAMAKMPHGGCGGEIARSSAGWQCAGGQSAKAVAIRQEAGWRKLAQLGGVNSSRRRLAAISAAKSAAA